MLCIGHRGRAGGDGGGSGCNAMPPKPLEGDLLFHPYFLDSQPYDALFGALFSLEQKEAPPPL